MRFSIKLKLAWCGMRQLSGPKTMIKKTFTSALFSFTHMGFSWHIYFSVLIYKYILLLQPKSHGQYEISVFAKASCSLAPKCLIDSQPAHGWSLCVWCWAQLTAPLLHFLQTWAFLSSAWLEQEKIWARCTLALGCGRLTEIETTPYRVLDTSFLGFYIL